MTSVYKMPRRYFKTPLKAHKIIIKIDAMIRGQAGRRADQYLRVKRDELEYVIEKSPGSFEQNGDTYFRRGVRLIPH